MAFTAVEEARLKAIEDAIIGLQVAIGNLASKKQLSQLSVLKQKDVDDLQTRVTALEATVQIIQAG